MNKEIGAVCTNETISLSKMKKSDSLYCKIFLDTNMEYSDLFSLVLNAVAGKKESINYIVADWCTISVRKNKEHIEKSEDYLFWNYFLDVEPKDIAANEYVRKIKELLVGLREKNIGVAVACEFEDELC